MLMSGNRYKVATIRGVPIYLGSSWIWVAFLYVFLQYSRFAESAWNPTTSSMLALTALSAVLFFGGVFLHECAHAAVARGFGLPVSGITLVFWGGATETPSNAKGPLAEFLVSAAGPATTLAIAGIYAAVAAQIAPGPTHDVVQELAGLNLLFAGFNALPGFPLDGGRMLLAGAWAATRNRNLALRIAGFAGIAVGAAMLAVAIISFQNGSGWWLFLGYIGFILVSTGSATSKRINLREQLAAGTVADAMRPPPDTVPATMTLSEALDHVLRENPTQSFPVVEGGRVIGTVSIDSARKIGQRDPFRRVRDGMRPLSQSIAVRPGDNLADAIEWLAGRDAMVLRDGVLVGAVGPNDIQTWYDRRRDPAAFAGHVPPRPDL
jgi:Zn-dependent protease/CBS domain-containing protein